MIDLKDLKSEEDLDRVNDPMYKYVKILSKEEILGKSEEVNVEDWDELSFVIAQMQIVVEIKSGIALAGPQVGYFKKIFVVKHHAPGKENVNDPWDICINPKIIPDRSAGMEFGDEGCLSIKGDLFTVERWKGIVLEWYTPEIDRISKQVVGMKKCVRKLHGLWARVAQHECDHFDGVLIDRVGIYIDQEKVLEERAKEAGLVWDKDGGTMLKQDPETGQMVSVDNEEVFDRVRKSVPSKTTKNEVDWGSLKEEREQKKNGKKDKKAQRRQERRQRKNGRG